MRDIRELIDDPDGYADELRRRWGGLLSYRYIGRSYASMDIGHVDNTVTLRSDMRDQTGGILLGVLAIASPEGGGMSDLDEVPNPVVHSCQIVDPGRDVQRIEVVSETLKRGRQMGYSRSKIVDADQPSRVLALTEGQGVVIGAPPEGLVRMELNPIVVEDSPALPPIWQVLGGTQRSDGAWAIGPLSTELASPDAALHLGPQVVICEQAARDAAARATGGPVSGVSSHVMFLARGKVGPFRAATDTVSGPAGTIGMRVTLHDEGANDAAITAASYLFRRA